jgi:hypothetical protein
MTEKDYPIGRLLRSGITGFVAGCPIVDQEVPRFGALVRAPLGPKDQIYGFVHEISIIDDGLVRQLVTRDQQVDATVIADNRTNRTVPMEISVLAVGYRRADAIHHSLPPRAPLSLDTIHQCSDAEIVAFTNAGRFGYLRHLLRNPELPVAELVAAHIAQADAAHSAAGDKDWRQRASQELIALLRDDYQTLMQVLGALADAV